MCQMGKCPIEEQRNVYFKLFKALNMVLSLEKPLKVYSSVKHEENISLIQLKPVERGTSRSKNPFNMNKAMENLQKCKKLLPNRELLSNTGLPDAFEYNTQPEALAVVSDAAVTNLVDAVSRFNQRFGHLKPLHSENGNNQYVSSDLSASIERLHTILESVDAAARATSDEVDMTNDLDSKKVFEDIKSFEKSSNIFKLKSYLN
uniref:Uncharacterized protein n=1 Tax=Graphocephala atropunctata TaxID=36148 RepID=A0A1B6MN94_9HEMI